MSRLPESRLRSVQSLHSASKTFTDHSITGLKTHSSIEKSTSRPQSFEVVFPSISNHLKRQTISYTKEPIIESKPIEEWTLIENGDCLHCGDPILKGQKYPIVKFKTDGNWWVFGQFCSSPCGLGYCREHTLGSQVEAWTRQMLRTVFKIEANVVAPPRFMLKRYGGSLDKPKFDSVSFCAIKSPPLSSFAMFAEVHADKKPAPFIDFSKGLSRPLTRDSMPTEARHTGKEPVLLKVLATSGTDTENTQNINKDENNNNDLSTSLIPTSPKRKRNKRSTSVPAPSTSTSSRKATTSLSCFMEVE
jgi:hypothetical protein